MALASISRERNLLMRAMAAPCCKKKQEIGDNQKCLIRSARLIQTKMLMLRHLHMLTLQYARH